MAPVLYYMHAVQYSFSTIFAIVVLLPNIALWYLAENPLRYAGALGGGLIRSK